MSYITHIDSILLQSCYYGWLITVLAGQALEQRLVSFLYLLLVPFYPFDLMLVVCIDELLIFHIVVHQTVNNSFVKTCLTLQTKATDCMVFLALHPKR